MRILKTFLNLKDETLMKYLENICLHLWFGYCNADLEHFSHLSVVGINVMNVK
jgi:hypothetical protein